MNEVPLPPMPAPFQGAKCDQSTNSSSRLFHMSQQQAVDGSYTPAQMRAYAREAVLMATDWRPIETAPHDERILLWAVDGGDDWKGGIVFGRKYASGNVRGEGMNGEWAFSHWMPLPSRPAAIRAGKQEQWGKPALDNPAYQQEQRDKNAAMRDSLDKQEQESARGLRGE